MENKKPRNRAQCRRCKDIIESRTRHEFVACKCGAIAVDGGLAYYRRVGNHDDFIEVLEDIKEA